MGLEKRAFLFTPEFERMEGEPFVAVDGGLIEIRVYRASHRVRRVQEPATYKSQEKYGIEYVSTLTALCIIHSETQLILSLSV